MKSLRFVTPMFCCWGLIALTTAFAQTYKWPFQNPTLGADDRINNFLSVAADSEKLRLMKDWPADTFPRLGFRMSGNAEGLHGAGQGVATQFCQAYGLGETWDTAMVSLVGSIEANEYRYMWERTGAGSLILRVPNCDLGRDPRWGRTEECYGEDPYLVGSLSMAMVRGVQGNNPTYLQAANILKHFLANSNEDNRMSSSSNFDQRLFREYYSVPFRMSIMEAGATSFMCAYNSYNDTPCTIQPVIKRVAIKEWGLNGCVSTDGSAVSAGLVDGGHKWYPNMTVACAGCILAGINMFLDAGYTTAVPDAIDSNLITEADRDTVLRGVVRTQLRLGVFDPRSMVPYANVGTTDPCQTTAHQTAARLVTEKSIVLLKNTNNLLPLDTASIKSIAVIGAMADSVTKDWYGGTPPYKITPLAGITARVGPGVTVNYAADNTNNAATNAAKSSSVAIVFVGNDPTCAAGWGVCTDPSEGKESIDRQTLLMDASAVTLIQQVYAANPKTIVVLLSSFPYIMTYVVDSIPAIVHITHCSQETGNALAAVLFGDYNPAGRLTQTWPASMSQLPTMMDYDIRDGRTYMYSTGVPQYPFGYGLSYTTFGYANLQTSGGVMDAKNGLTVSFQLTNTGKVAGEEVAQLYVKHLNSAVSRPIKELRNFQRVALNAGATTTVSMSLSGSDIAYWDSVDATWYAECDNIQIQIGASSADIRLDTTLAVINCGPITMTSVRNPLPGRSIVKSAVSALSAVQIVRRGQTAVDLLFHLNAAAANVDLRVYSLNGRLIANLRRENLSAGTYNVALPGFSSSSGVYLVSGATGGGQRSVFKCCVR